MTDIVKIDIVDLDDGHNAYYVNGELVYGDCGENPRMIIAELVRGKTVLEYNDTCLGSYGRSALVYDHAMPNNYWDIPDRWWTEDEYDGTTL